MMMRPGVRLAICTIAFAISALPSNADVFNVLDYGAVGDGHNDDAVPIQQAIDDAIAQGGGTVYFPAGEYRLASLHHEQVEGEGRFGHIVVSGSGIRLLGDASAGPGAGSRLIADSCDAAAIVIGVADTGVSGVVIEHLSLTRTCASTDLAEGAAGILFDNLLDANPSWLWNCRMDNVVFTDHLDGIRSSYRSSADYANPQALMVSRCEFRDIRRYGINLPIAGETTIQACKFIQCGTPESPDSGGIGGGLRWERRLPGIGTLVVQGSTFFACETGITIVGIEERARDIHITGCQIDLSGSFGIFVEHAQNMVLAGSSLTSNAATRTNLNGVASLRINDAISCSITGVNIRGSGANGMILKDCDTVTISGCTIDWNGQRLEGAYAIVINGGQSLSIGSTAIRTRAAQRTNGIWIQGGPRNLLGTGVLFSEGFGTDPGGDDMMFGNTGTPQGASGEIEYWDPESEEKRVLILD